MKALSSTSGLPSLGTAILALASLIAPAAAHEGDAKLAYLVEHGLPGPLTQPQAGWDQLNMTFHANLAPNQLGTGASSTSDCWGYTAPSGREYAIVGTFNGPSFVEITNPASPVVVDAFQWSSCTWYDLTVFEDHAYVVNDCTTGFQIYDMSAIDSGTITLVDTQVDVGSTSHNIAINTESGFLYRMGGAANGLVIYDLNADPSAPQYVTTWQERYVHDAWIHTFTSGPYAGREIGFCNSGFSSGSVQTGLDILDLTDKNNIVLLDRYVIPGAVYSHQGCLSSDGTLLYMGDELDETPGGSVTTTTYAIDVSDLSNVQVASTFTNGNTSKDHNLYVVGDLIIEANFMSGLRVYRADDPLNPVEVAYFDTFPDSDDPGYWGLWSNYPFLPSGRIIATGTGGLWVFDLDLPGEQGTPYCFGDGSGTTCPCANAGSSGEGCANSTGSGASLAASGSTSVLSDDLEFHVESLAPSQPALCFVGTATIGGGNGATFGDGLRCVDGQVVRLGVMAADAGGSASWGPGLGSLGGWSAGQTRFFQAWYRDPGGPCGGGFNLSNAIEVQFQP